MIEEKHQKFPLINGAYRVVSAENYAKSFGFQWNKFECTQMDRFHNGVDQSSERFWKETGWSKEELAGKKMLEVGSGAGRFTKVILQETEADLYSVDYSNAVEANYRNNGPNNRLHLFQASIYEMPFKERQFDFVCCLGVLQHTPNFKKSVEILATMVKPGGKLAIDFYENRGWFTKIHAKYIFRPFTKRMSHESLLQRIERNVRWLIGTYRILDRLGLYVLTRFLPICDIKNTLPQNLSDKQLREWVILDTFDMFSPEHDHPQPIETVKKWLEKELYIDFAGHVHLNAGKGAVIRASRK